MRLNKYIAFHTGLSRRRVDKLIKNGKIQVNGQPASLGQDVSKSDKVIVDDLIIHPQATVTTLMLNKPVGYVCSRNGQGSKTIYDLLPPELHHLKPVGRLDRDSSGLLLLTNDGDLANQLMHPSHQKTKIYEIELNQPMSSEDLKKVINEGVELGDGLSKFRVEKINHSALYLRITMQEGRNRQIRRTFAVLGYKVVKLHRTHFGEYVLGSLQIGDWKNI